MNGISTHVGADSTSCSHELPVAAEGEHYTGLARSTILCTTMIIQSVIILSL